VVDTVSWDATEDMTEHGKATGGGLEGRENRKEGTTRGDGIGGRCGCGRNKQKGGREL